MARVFGRAVGDRVGRRGLSPPRPFGLGAGAEAGAEAGAWLEVVGLTRVGLGDKVG